MMKILVKLLSLHIIFDHNGLYHVDNGKNIEDRELDILDNEKIMEDPKMAIKENAKFMEDQKMDIMDMEDKADQKSPNSFLSNYYRQFCSLKTPDNPNDCTFGMEQNICGQMICTKAGTTPYNLFSDLAWNTINDWSQARVK